MSDLDLIAEAFRISEAARAEAAKAKDIALAAQQRAMTPGPVGPRGELGAIGPAGVPGLAGERGVDGSIGPQGPQGVQGFAGAVGPIGPRGERGLRGSKGDTGANRSGITWRGDWSAAETYHPNDAVHHYGSSWIATDETRAEPPGTGWDQMADRGQTGQQGPQGATGPQGPQGVAGTDGDGIGGLVVCIDDPDNPRLVISLDTLELVVVG